MKQNRETPLEKTKPSIEIHSQIQPTTQKNKTNPETQIT